MSDQNQENQFEEYQPEPGAEEPAPPSKGPGNRNFLIAIGVIGAVFLLALIAMAVFAANILPQRQAAQRTQAAQILLMNTATSAAATQVALAQITPSSTPPPTSTNTAVPPTNTPVLVLPTSTSTPEPTGQTGTGQGKAETPSAAQLTSAASTSGAPTVNATLSPGAARTATLAVLLTQVAAGKKTTPVAGGVAAVQPTATALPSTGFADQVGLPSLFGIALALVALIFIVRALRLSAR